MDRQGVERKVAEEVEVTVTHTVKYGDHRTEYEVSTDLPDTHDGARYVYPSIYYILTDEVGIDPESARIHKFESD